MGKSIKTQVNVVQSDQITICSDIIDHLIFDSSRVQMVDSFKRLNISLCQFSLNRLFQIVSVWTGDVLLCVHFFTEFSWNGFHWILEFDTFEAFPVLSLFVFDKLSWKLFVIWYVWSHNNSPKCNSSLFLVSVVINNDRIPRKCVVNGKLKRQNIIACHK